MSIDNAQTTDIVETVVANYLGKLFAFSLARTGNREDAEDLCQDIVAEIIYSASTIRQPKALHGWMWAVARNTHVRWVRKRTLDDVYRAPLPDDFETGSEVSPEQLLIAVDDRERVRREIGLLSRAHREVIVQHYLHDRGCAQIAASMGISESMVKYHLATARQKLKDGITMVRERGTTSIDPGDFAPCWWGMARQPAAAGDWLGVLKRRLPGNLLQIAYKKPASVQDMSLETDVPVTYLEDELSILVDYGMLDPAPAGRFETNLCIIDKDCCDAIGKLFADRAPALADQIYEGMKSNEAAIRSIGFHGADMDWNQLIWLSPVIMYCVMSLTLQNEILTHYPLLKTGARAWTWAIERKFHIWEGRCAAPSSGVGHTLRCCDFWQLNRLMDRPHNLGTGPLDRPNAIRLLASMTGDGLDIDTLTDADADECAVLVDEHFAVKRSGHLFSRIPIFDEPQARAFFELIARDMPFVETWFREIQRQVTDLLKGHVPKRFAADLGQYAYLQTLLAKAYVIAALSDAGRLEIPERHAHAMVIMPETIFPVR